MEQDYDAESSRREHSAEILTTEKVCIDVIQTLSLPDSQETHNDAPRPTSTPELALQSVTFEASLITSKIDASQSSLQKKRKFVLRETLNEKDRDCKSKKVITKRKKGEADPIHCKHLRESAVSQSQAAPASPSQATSRNIFMVTVARKNRKRRIVANSVSDSVDRVFACTQPNCGKAFASSRALGGHNSKIHRGMSQAYQNKIKLSRERAGLLKALRIT